MEEILLESIVNRTEDSEIFSSRIFLRAFFQLGLKFPSDREELLVEMYILLSLELFGTCGRGEKMGNK